MGTVPISYDIITLQNGKNNETAFQKYPKKEWELA
jgi:hypothetical protein